MKALFVTEFSGSLHTICRSRSRNWCFSSSFTSSTSSSQLQCVGGTAGYDKFHPKLVHAQCINKGSDYDVQVDYYTTCAGIVDQPYE